MVLTMVDCSTFGTTVYIYEYVGIIGVVGVCFVYDVVIVGVVSNVVCWL